MMLYILHNGLLIGICVAKEHSSVPQVWMCIGRDLKPMECPTPDNKQCRDVLIPHLPAEKESHAEHGDDDNVKSIAIEIEVRKDEQ